MHDQSAVTTFLFTDIEGSTRLWEQDSERMRPALARHDAIVRLAVESHHGSVVKMTGDGVHAVFADAIDAIEATLNLQHALKDTATTGGVALHVRCGLHAGAVERRDNDYFGSPVNRAARIMSTAHGGQILVSHAIAALVGGRLPGPVALRDLGTVRLRDLANPEHVYQVVHPDLRQDFPALRSLEATPNNLPQQVTSFIGREREQAEVKALLRKSRLLTLLGAGGLGKTRLSLQVGADVMDDYSDGVWFVELAPVTDAFLMPQAVASVLGVKEEAGRPVQEALVKHARDRRLLLVLDNCEHLARACAELARQLLQSGPHLTILASSREPLHVAGETTYAVPTLGVPDTRNGSSAAGLKQFEAIRLFIERAVAAQPTFQLTDQNAAAVGDICRRLDGIPLAIEFAAARVRALSVEKIAERLSDRFALLTSGDRTVLPRQQTLRALIDWSYELLTQSERVLLQRLSVFAGGWTVEAAEAVGAGEALARANVLDCLTNLVEKSLVAMEAEGQRYRLLETVREYARERLEAAWDDEPTRGRHLDFYLALAERARPELVGKDQGTWFTKLDQERENLLSAHAWCDRVSNGAALGLRLASAMRRYWIVRGQLGLGHRVTIEALARREAQSRNALRCRALYDAGQMSAWMGLYAEAQGYLQESLAIARELADKPSVARALQPLALACLGQKDLPAAREHLEEAIALAQELGNQRDFAAALNALAQIHRAQGDIRAAEPLYERVLVLARELGDDEIVSLGLLNLAMVWIGRGAVGRAGALLREVLAILGRTGSKPAGQSLLEVCAGLAATQAEWKRAAEFYGCVETQMQQTGLQRDPADEAFLAPLVAEARHALGANEFDAAEAAGRARSYDEAIASARTWLENRF